MGPRFWGGSSPCSCSVPVRGPRLRPRTPQDLSVSRCSRWSGAAVAQGPDPPAQQPPSPHGGLAPDPSPREPLALRTPVLSGRPSTASFAQKLRSPAVQADQGG